MFYLVNCRHCQLHLLQNTRSSNNQTDSDADIEKQNCILDEINRTYGNIESV